MAPVGHGYSELGVMERLATLASPLHQDLFGTHRTKAPTRISGVQGDQSQQQFLGGKTWLVLQLSGMPESREPDNPLGEVLIEGTVDSVVWFEVCRLRHDGVYNLAKEAQRGPDSRAVDAVTDGSRILLARLRASVVKLPVDADPISLVIFGV